MKIDHVKVDRAEYEALRELRDVAHETLVRKYDALLANYRSTVDANLSHVHAAAKQELTVIHLREKNLEQHKLILQMQKRLAELEPVKMETASPMFVGRK